jgi:Tfp pilus assembly protein PilF
VNASNPEAWNNLANVRKDLGDPHEAESFYLKTLKIRPQSGAAAVNLGLLYLQTGHLADAASWFRHALRVDVQDADAHNNLGTVLRMQGNSAEAEYEFRQAVAANPAHPEGHCGLGDVLQLRGALDEAETCCRRALELRPAYPDALNNLATIATARGHKDAARAYCEEALRADRNHVATLNNLGSLAVAGADYTSAEGFYRQALAIDRRRHVTRFNLATTRLTLGDYSQGFDFYESRFEAFQRPFRTSPTLNKKLQSLARWDGAPLGDSNLLIWTEQGLGDSLMMLRYLPELCARGVERITVLCDPQLARVVQAMETAEHVITQDEQADGMVFAAHSPMMSLPRAFGTRLDSIPQLIPYVRIPREAASDWSSRFTDARPRIGLVWAGSPSLRDDALRSIPLEHFAPILKVDQVHFVSLQKGDAAADWGDFGGDQYIDQCDDLFDTAALIMNLDLVISVDTAVAHLAGALGKSVWLLNRFGSEWRWGLSGAKSAWYPTMEIFREAHPGGWGALIQDVAKQLRERFGSGSAR